MKRLLHRSFYMLAVVCTFSMALSASGQQYRLKNVVSELTIRKDGSLVIKPLHSPGIEVSVHLQDLWSLSLTNIKESTDLAPRVYQVKPAKVSISKAGPDNLTLSYPLGFTSEGKPVPVRLTLQIVAKASDFEFGCTIECDTSQWLLREFSYPRFTAIKSTKASKLYLPNGLGQCFDDSSLTETKSFDYPSGRGTMQWFTINSPDVGVYFASHDSSRSKKQFQVSYDKKQRRFQSSISFPVYSHRFRVPQVVVNLYQGTWHTAAKKYRQWYDQHFTSPELPAWVKKDAGWILAILKQQNGYVMWRYNDLDKLCDIAEKLNMTTIGLFGWANGGHDYLYPNYIPDDLLGGYQALKDAIARAHQRGIKIILYANGTLIDASTEYYRYNGNNTIALREDKSAYTSSIRKYNSSTPVVFTEASYSSKLWRKTMLDLALQAHELGADGILYDQVGVKGALLNFSKNQGHKLPQEAGTYFRYLMMHEIRTTLKALNPNFVIMTEGVNDGVYTDIDYYHGWGEGTFIAPNAFAGLFRYTFPELVKTQRHSSPLLTRSRANYAAVYGLRHEIETRWEADVAYLLQGKLPDEKSYQDEAYFPPDYKSIRAVPPAEATRYIHDLIAFENRHAEFFRYGRFIDEEGFRCTGDGLMAKGYRTQNKLGIVIWNQHEGREQTFRLEVPGYHLSEVFEVDGNTKGGGVHSILPNSIKLLVYLKD